MCVLFLGSVGERGGERENTFFLLFLGFGVLLLRRLRGLGLVALLWVGYEVGGSLQDN